uniref:Uncharacterized protein n=1 Tax=Lepeophtheirus salmonis TaxID=72036 RepID=A0A0K2UYV9_LEPSM
MFFSRDLVSMYLTRWILSSLMKVSFIVQMLLPTKVCDSDF